MCRATTIKCAQCGDEEIRYHERCPNENEDFEQSHRIYGIVTPTPQCSDCQNLERIAASNQDPALADVEIAMAVSKYLRHERDTPLSDTEIERRRQGLANNQQFLARKRLHPYPEDMSPWGGRNSLYSETYRDMFGDYLKYFQNSETPRFSFDRREDCVVSFWRRCEGRQKVIDATCRSIDDIDLGFWLKNLTYILDPIPLIFPPLPAGPPPVKDPHLGDIMSLKECSSKYERPEGLSMVQQLTYDINAYLEYLLNFPGLHYAFTEAVSDIRDEEQRHWNYYPEFILESQGMLASLRAFISPWTKLDMSYQECLVRYTNYIGTEGGVDHRIRFQDAHDIHTLTMYTRLDQIALINILDIEAEVLESSDESEIMDVDETSEEMSCPYLDPRQTSETFMNSPPFTLDSTNEQFRLHQEDLRELISRRDESDNEEPRRTPVRNPQRALRTYRNQQRCPFRARNIPAPHSSEYDSGSEDDDDLHASYRRTRRGFNLQDAEREARHRARTIRIMRFGREREGLQNREERSLDEGDVRVDASDDEEESDDEMMADFQADNDLRWRFQPEEMMARNEERWAQEERDEVNSTLLQMHLDDSAEETSGW